MNGKITITVYKAVLTKDVCTFSTMDPYFICSLSSAKTYKSRIRKNEGKYPSWNETFTFDINGELGLITQVYHEREMVLTLINSS